MPMRRSNSNASLALASVLLAASAAVAAQVVAPATPALSPPVQTTDTLLDALTCRTSAGDIAGLLARLRRERPSEFVQTERQYGTPKMDLYRLDTPVDAWGNEGDAVVITDDRVLLLVDAPIDTASMRLEQSLADSREAPLSGALDDLHALVVYAGEHPGMQQRTLIGCEYRMPGLSLLANPDDAWRTPTP